MKETEIIDKPLRTYEIILIPFAIIAALILIGIFELYEYLKPKWYKRFKCRMLHRKKWSFNIIVTSIGSVSHHYCNKCKIKH